MDARRWIVFLLMCLIPLYPVQAGAVVQQTAPEPSMQMSLQPAALAVMHDCCATSSAADHGLKINGGCDSGHCISHCVVSLMDVGGSPQLPLSFVHALPRMLSFSSITLETPSRPPSLL